MRLDFRHPYTGELQTIIVGRGSEFDRAIVKLEPKEPRHSINSP
jgi:hypothetical protein